MMNVTAKDQLNALNGKLVIRRATSEGLEKAKELAKEELKAHIAEAIALPFVATQD